MNRNQILCGLVTGITFLVCTITLFAQETSELPGAQLAAQGLGRPYWHVFIAYAIAIGIVFFLGCFDRPAPLGDREEDRQLKRLESAVTLFGLVVRSDEVRSKFFIILSSRNDDASYTPVPRTS